MAIGGELSAGKVYIGPELPARLDQSALTLDDDANPFSGTLACVGPAFFGAPTNIGFARAVVNVGPAIPPMIPGIPSLGLEVTGGTHHQGYMNNFGLSNMFGISNTLGILNKIGINNAIGLSNRMGYNVAVGGETNVQPIQNDAALGKTSACPLYTHHGNMYVNGHFSAASKAFEIDHPSKPGKKLYHGSLEGPEHGVYVRGRVTIDGIIELPEYWKDLIDPETITVQLTPHRFYQELFVDRIEWGTRVIVRNSSGGAIDAYYLVQAERKDIDKLVVEP
jgi:hypothetical protein